MAYRAPKSEGLRGLRMGGLRIGARGFAISRPRTPSCPLFRWQMRVLRKKSRGMHTSGASWTMFEAVPGPA
eukprot:7264990-Alexandrium_andersonii.AAC.1